MSEVELDYLEEGGPGVAEIPEHMGEPVTSETDQAPPLYPGWEPETINTFLQGTGAGIHMLIGQTDEDWLMTQKDLERIGPPLTRICNRWEPALRLSPVADPLLVAHGFALYGWRSALETKRAQRDKEEPREGPRAAYVDEHELDEEEAGPGSGQEEELVEQLDQPSYFENGGAG